MSGFPGRRQLASVSLVVLLLLAGSVSWAAEQPSATAKAGDDKPLPPECALLDDPEKRALMDGLLFKLLHACGRTDELGGVHQEPFEPMPAPIDNEPDVAVNDPTGDSGSATTQSETSMALNEDTGTICAGYNDSYHYSAGGNGFTGFSRSTDGGASFDDRGALGAGSGGDPSIVWRRADGHFYFAALHTNGLGLWKSTDDCQSFQWVGMAHSGFSDDKELMAVDNEPSSPYYGRLYMAFTNFSADSRIWALSSADAGVTWTSGFAISSSSNVQGAWPVVAPNGDVFIGWVTFAGGSFGTVTIDVARSTDGGTSYATVTPPAVGKSRPANESATNSCGRSALNGNIRYLPSPQLAVGADGVLHVVYSYSPNADDDCDSFYRRSTDNGSSWGPEVRLHDDATTSDQFFPTLSVGEGNIVSATWYDRRLDPANLLLDHFQAFSYDGGVTWQPSQRISDVSTPIRLDPGLATCYHGDYDTHVQTATHAVAQWSDDRNIVNGHNDADVFAEPIPVSTDFLLTASPGEISVCAPDNGVVTVDVLQFLGFAEPVTLAATGVPAGASAGFVPNPVAPPGTSTLTIGGTAGAAPGSYEISIVGTSSPSNIVHQADITLHLYNANPGVVDPVAPADGALNQPTRPNFVWTTATQGATYRLQVATDPEFNTVVLDVSGLSEPTHVPTTDLQSNTPHYWRVQAVNACGAGPWSSVFSFVTRALPGDCGLGTVSVGHYSEDFESGAPGWTHFAASGPDTWALTGGINGTHSGSFVYHADDVVGVSDQRLRSPMITLPAGVHSSITLQYWTYQDLEDDEPYCWDAGILEISADGGPFTQLLDPVLLTDPYDGIIRNTSSNPLSDQPGWCGSPQPWVKSVVDLDDYAGQTVEIRFRLGTDVAVGHPGWDIDDVAIRSCIPDAPPLFADGFEDGTTDAWSAVQP
jgi:hypothetical protein